MLTKSRHYLFTIIVLVFLIAPVNLTKATDSIECGNDAIGEFINPKKGKVADLTLIDFHEALSPNEIYKLTTGDLNGAVTVNIWENKSGGAKVLETSFTESNIAWGFSPDDHRFIVHYMNSTSHHEVLLFDLRSGSNLPVRTIGSTLVAGGEAIVRFSPTGTSLMYASDTGPSQVYLTLVDTAGIVRHENTFTFQAFPGSPGDKQGMVHWGYSPDSYNRTFVYAYINGSNSAHFNMINLERGTIVLNGDLLDPVSSFWQFSPAGDKLGRVIQESLTQIRVQLISTLDGNIAPNTQYPFGEVQFIATEDNHWAYIGGTAYNLSANTAGQPCPEYDPPEWPDDATITASNLTFTDVDLAWPRATDQSGIEEYRLLQDGVSLTVQPDTFYQVTDLIPGTEYNFTVEASDIFGNWSGGNPSITLTTPGDSDPPVWQDNAGIGLYSSYSDRLTLYWFPPEDPSGVIKHKVFQDGAELDIFDTNPDATYEIWYQVSGLTGGTEYTFRIEAMDQAGNWTEDGPSVTVVYDQNSPPSWPAGSTVSVDSVGTTGIMIHWDPATDNHSIQQYEIYTNGRYSAPTYAPNMVYPPPTEIELDNLEPLTTYKIAVIAMDENYLYSTDTLFTTTTTPADTEPPVWLDWSNLSACQTGATWIKLYWEGATDNVEITHYLIYQDGTVIDTVDMAWDGEEMENLNRATEDPNSSWNSSRYTVEGLTPGTTYSFRVGAGDAANNYSLPDPEVTATTRGSESGDIAPLASHYTVDYLFPDTTVANSTVALNDNNMIVGRSGTLGFFWEDGSYRTIGDLGNGYSRPKAMSNDGRVAGESAFSGTVDEGFYAHGNILLSLGTYVEFLNGSRSQADWVVPGAVNDSGVVVGWARYAPIGSPGWQSAFRWKQDRFFMEDLGTLGGEQDMYYWERVSSSAVDINNQGQIVGESPAPGPNDHAFLWENGEMTDLGTLGGSTSRAVAINESGQVIGSSLTSGGDQHAFLWSNGLLTDLGSFDDNSYPYDLNENGAVVGYSHVRGQDCDGRSINHPFLYDGTRLLDLGTLGGLSGWASDLNDNNIVVGRSETPDGSEHAFVWQSGKMYRFDDKNATSSYAVAINNNGWVLINAVIDGQLQSLVARPGNNANNYDGVIISEVMDGNRGSGLPKYIEVYNASDSTREVNQATIKIGTDGSANYSTIYSFPNILLESGQAYVVTTETDTFDATYGADARDAITSAGLGDGNDVYALYSPGDSLLDIFGTPGKNYSWYENSYAERIATVRRGNQAYTESEWDITPLADGHPLKGNSENEGTPGTHTGGETVRAQDTTPLPLEFAVSEAYPNPFNRTATLEYAIPKEAQVLIQVYDLRGQLVDTPWSRRMAPGNYILSLDFTGYSSGVYFVRFSSGQFMEARKLLLLK
ncbi:MAG: fibronectin type III domain-containing protein [Candidatus Marinimicrobia bacterium]|nr:fibronectin type III domain-containing protein [Candidatus Neomarinimicrobiota bacterium]MCF7828390.1 fibronectin type III domain-containing protein [Candidatus Neomarinimicrobiota bacterium]MCF7881016.1 fibronectin type III domain-containing protein [Candidatus Neomarinimicrobiota bacterium]